MDAAYLGKPDLSVSLGAVTAAFWGATNFSEIIPPIRPPIVKEIMTVSTRNSIMAASLHCIRHPWRVGKKSIIKFEVAN